MKPTTIFPICMIIGDIGAASMYAWHKDWRMTIYWLSAATLTASITF